MFHSIASLAAAMAFCAAGGDARLGAWAAPDTCKVNPVSGNVLEEHEGHVDPNIPPPAYLRRKMGERKGLPYYARDSYEKGPPSGQLRRGSPVWDAETRTVRLKAARNEFAAFQVIVESLGREALKDVRLEVSLGRGPAAFDSGKNVRCYRQHYMRLARHYTDSWAMTAPVGEMFWYPEALCPLDLPGAMPFDVPDGRLKIVGQRNQAVWVDVYVPHGTAPGRYEGDIRLRAANAAAVELKLSLEVLPLELPDELTFAADMMVSPRPILRHWKLSLQRPEHRGRYLALEESFYRLFHEHRCTMNVFPGSPTRRGSTPEQVVFPGFAPKTAGAGESFRVADWSEYDAHYGKYFTGEAFRDLPRAGRPLRHHFLPFSLGWPSKFSQYYDARATYETEFQRVLRDFAEHFAAKGWTRTKLLVFLNGKRKWGEPWNTDEPTSKDDYAALRRYGQWVREALGPRAQRKAPILFRVDIGTPQRMVGELDEVVDIRNVNYEAYNETGFFWSAFRRKQEAAAETWWYYAADRANQRWARVDWSMASSYLWAWAMWDLNVRVCCKWASLLWGTDDPIAQAGVQWNYCAYAYPGTPFGLDGAVAGLKLKALRRGLEDMEYLALLAGKDGSTKRADALLRKYYAAWDRKAGEPYPPGTVRVGPLDPLRLREEIVAALLDAPASKDAR